MDKERIEYWQDEMSTCRTFMEAKHKQWLSCLDQYSLDFSNIPGLDQRFVVRLSRIYPVVRQILASVAFNYPYIFASIRPNMTTDSSLPEKALIIERAANETLRLTRFKPEAHQIIFDMLFCSIGWAKQTYWSKDTEAFAPYVVNDPNMIDFVHVCRINPFRIMPDPAPFGPQRIGYARYIIEDMLVPREFVERSGRYTLSDELPVMTEESKVSVLASFEAGQNVDAQEAIKKSLMSGKFVHLSEIHDRTNRQLITFAEGVESPIEERDHPFANVKPTQVPDPVTGQPLTVGFEPAPGYLVEDGFPYVDLRIDMDIASFYPNPPIAYIQDLEQLVVESVSRRRQLLQRFKRILYGEISARSQNSSIDKELQEAEDGDIVWMSNLSAFKEANFGSPPTDQLNLEADARRYEEQVLHVQDFSQGGSRKSATEVAVAAGQGSLNREWIQDKISGLYNRVVTNALHTFRDVRYTPEQFIINLGKTSQDINMIVLTSHDFDPDFVLDVDAASMQPLIEQLDKDDVILLYDRLVQSPHVNRRELDEMLIKSVRGRVPDAMLKAGPSEESQKLAEIETVAYLLRGGDPGVMEGEDHQAHLAVQSPQAIQARPDFRALDPQIQPMVLQAVNQHAQAHVQAFMATTSAASSGGSMPSVDGRMLTGGGSSASLQSLVRANAQEYAQQAASDVRTLSRQGG